MRYSTEPKFRKYVKGNGFGDKHGKKLIDTATKQGQMQQKLRLKE